MRKLLMTTSFLLFCAVPVAAAQGSNDATKRMELAQEYSTLVPVDAEIDKTIEQIALQVPVDQRVLFKSILARTIKADRLRSASELALVEIFTADELQALVDLYKTPQGRSIKDKMPEYQERLQPVLEQMIRDAAASLQQQIQSAN